MGDADGLCLLGLCSHKQGGVYDEYILWLTG